ncbi:MAG: PAS domain S-box protein, partial [Anaerolineae bacterium]|nr:PAS domain S-box protein [Anaerolineae bacterium]
ERGRDQSSVVIPTLSISDNPVVTTPPAHEDRFRLLAEAAFEVVVISENGKILDINDRVKTMFGYEPAEVLEQEIWQFIDESSIEMVRTIISRGNDQPYQARFRRKDGTTFAGQVLGREISYQGRAVRVATIQDISERQRYQESLRESQQLLQLIMNNIPQTAFWKNRDSVYLGCNRAFAEDAGLDNLEDIIGKTDYDLPWTTEEADAYRAADRRVMESNHPELHIIETQRRADGKLTWLDTNKIPLHDAEGKVIGMLGTYEDITERREAEETLAKRAVELALVAQVSQQAATTRNPKQMLQDVSDMTKEQFGLYHAHIYLLDATGDRLDLTAGAGEAGRQMIAQGWSIPFDRADSLVAQAARTRQGVIVNDVRQNPGFLPNPLLPETRSEMSVPMVAGDKLIGVLDVQADTVGRFSDDDVQIQTTLAAQVAVALENSQLLEQAQQNALRTETQARHERLLREITDRVRDAADIDTIMRTTVREVGRALGREVFVSIGNQRQADDAPPPQQLPSPSRNGHPHKHHPDNQPIRPTEEK